MRRFLAALIVCALGLCGIPAYADAWGKVTDPRHVGMIGATAGFPVPSASRSSAVIGHRPAGCPHAFCGCALSIKLFGSIRPSLNIAENWKGFDRSSPAPGMVAARRGHVFQLVSHVAGDVWTVWDPNSGGHAIRIHQRSIAGYSIHNPFGSLAYYSGRPGRHVRYARHHHRRFASRA